MQEHRPTTIILQPTLPARKQTKKKKQKKNHPLRFTIGLFNCYALEFSFISSVMSMLRKMYPVTAKPTRNSRMGISAFIAWPNMVLEKEGGWWRWKGKREGVVQVQPTKQKKKQIACELWSGKWRGRWKRGRRKKNHRHTQTHTHTHRHTHTDTQTHRHRHTHTFASPSGKVKYPSKRTVGPEEDKHATE